MRCHRQRVQHASLTQTEMHMEDESPHVEQARAIYLTLREKRGLTDAEFGLFLALEEIFDLKLMRQRKRLEKLDERAERRRFTAAESWPQSQSLRASASTL